MSCGDFFSQTGAISMAVNRWLIFSYFANISGKASAQHVDDRIAHLAALGVEPVILSSLCGERSDTWIHLRVPSFAPSGVRFELRYLKRRKGILRFFALPATVVVLPFYLLEKLLIDMESQWSWFPLAFLRGARECWRSRPKTVYSTGGPASAHIAAGLVAQVFRIPWIAELQDPLVFKDWHRSGRALRANAAIERFILRKASAVVFLATGARERAIARTGAEPSKCHVIYPGAPEESGDEPFSGTNFCRFGHFGSLGGSRNVQVFLEGLRAAIAANPALAGIVRFDLYGITDKLSRDLINQFEYPEVVADHGKISRPEARKAMKDCDVLVMIQNSDDISFETIPSKVYEYLHMKRAIFGLVYRNSFLREMLLSRGHFVSEADSTNDVCKTILSIVDKWREKALQPSRGNAAPYTVRAAVERLVEVSASLPAASPQNGLKANGSDANLAK